MLFYNIRYCLFDSDIVFRQVVRDDCYAKKILHSWFAFNLNVSMRYKYLLIMITRNIICFSLGLVDDLWCSTIYLYCSTLYLYCSTVSFWVYLNVAGNAVSKYLSIRQNTADVLGSFPTSPRLFSAKFRIHLYLKVNIMKYKNNYNEFIFLFAELRN